MFLKKATSSWSRRVERIIKTRQDKNKKLVKILFAESATRVSRLTKLPALPSRSPAAPALPKLKVPRSVTPTAPGKWLKSHHAVNVLEGGRPMARMSYWLYLPDKPAKTPLPLVVMLHGCAQTATQFAQSTRMNLLAEKKGFAVLYPQQSATTQGPGRCWRWYKKEIQEGGGEVQSVVAIINSVVDQYALDRSRIYIAGISAGAAMAHIIGLNYPHLIAAVGMHSGSVFGAAESPMEGYAVMQRGAANMLRSAIQEAAAKFVHFPAMPAILIHGREDTIVRPINLAHLAEQFRELNGLSGHGRETLLAKITETPASARGGNAYTAYEYYAGRKLLLKACEVIGLDHAWSGGDESASFSCGKGPDASKLMWDFFSKHSRASGAASASGTFTNIRTAKK